MTAEVFGQKQVDDNVKKFIEQLQNRSTTMTAAKEYDSSGLENAIKEIEELDARAYGTNTFIQELASQFRRMYSIVTKTDYIIKSPSYKTLTKQKKSLESQKKDVNKQLGFAKRNLSTLSNGIASYASKIALENSKRSELSTQAKEMENNLEDVQSYMQDEKDSNELANLAIELERYRLDYETVLDQVRTQEEIVDTYNRTRAELFEEKKNQEMYKRVLHYNNILIDSEIRRIDYYIKRESAPSPISSLLSLKKVRGVFYDFQHKLIDSERDRNELYNTAVKEIPTDRELGDNVIARKKSVPRIV